MIKRLSSYRGRFFAVAALIILGCGACNWIVNADIAPLTYPAYTGTDTKVIPSAPALGLANSVFNDPTFGSRILRVTDQNTQGGQSYISTQSGFQRTFNANSTALKLTGPHGDGYWLEFNPGAFTVGDGSSKPVPHQVSFGANWEWSAVDPDIIYFLNGNQIAKYNKSTLATTNLRGPSNGDSVAYATAVIGQDNWVCAAAGSGSQNTYTKIFCVNPADTSSFQFIDVYKQTINGVTAANLTNWPTSASGQVIGIHSISGGTGPKWLQITFHGGNWGGNNDAVYNLETQTWSLLTAADGYWSGHVSVGNGTFANGGGSANGRDSRGFILRDPDNLTSVLPNRFAEQPPDTSNGWCDGEHSSWLNSASNPQAPILISRYTILPACNYAWTGEILLAAVDGSNKVWRIAHNHNGGWKCFYASAFAQISSDGKWAIFSSDWDGTLGLDTAFGCKTRIDTFIVDLTGASTASSSTTSITPTPVTTPSTRIEESDPSMSYAGYWFRLPNTGINTVLYSGGTAQESMDVGSVATLSFNGIGVTFITYCDQWSGIAQIYVDGNPTDTVDLYEPGAKYQAKIYTVSGLTSGPHTVGIGPTGKKNSSSSGLWIAVDAFDVAQTPPAAAGQSLTTSGGISMQIGSAEVVAPAGQNVPSGLAIFGYRQNGVLVSEAAVPASTTMARGRIYADVSGLVNTGVALANPNDSAALVSFYFTDSNGTDFGNGSLTIPAHGQVARFLSESPFDAPSPMNGTLTFNSNVPVSAIAIRGLTNERSEFLVTTEPVGNPDAQVTDSVFFPHFADGGGWITEFVLVNPSDQTISGTLTFFAQGTPGTAAANLAMNIAGATVSQITYSIPARSAKRFSTGNTALQVTVGTARVTPALLNAAPVGVAFFSLRSAGITVSEAGTPSTSTGNAFRMYAEADDASGIETGVAVENAGSSDTPVTFELTRLDGTSTGLTGQLVIPAFGQRALFLNQIPGLESLAMPFKGVLRISSAQPNIAVLGVRRRWNERGDFIFTTTPATNENAPPNSQIVFAHIADGGGYSTQFILFSGTPTQPAFSNLQIFSQSGANLSIGLR